MPLVDEFVAQGSQQMGLPGARPANCNHVDRLVEEAAITQPRDHLPYRRREAVELEGVEGLAWWQVRIVQKPRSAPLVLIFPFQPRQFVEELLVRQALAGGFQGQV